MATTKIGDIRRKLDACISLKNAQDSAARVYDDSVILVDQAKTSMDGAEQVFVEAALAVEAAIDAKLAAAEALTAGAADLLNTIKNTKVKGSDRATNQRGGRVTGAVTDALSACLAIRETVNAAANKADQLKSIYESAAETESIANAALNVAESAWTERVRLYEDAKAAAESAQAAMIEAAKILGV